jgi:hypothetical protein
MDDPPDPLALSLEREFPANSVTLLRRKASSASIISWPRVPRLVLHPYS